MLNKLITSKTRLRLLIKFFISQTNSGYLNGLANEMGESTNSIRKELNHLYEAGYIDKIKNVNKIEYKVNSNHPLYETLKTLFSTITSALNSLGGLLSTVSLLFPSLQAIKKRNINKINIYDFDIKYLILL